MTGMQGCNCLPWQLYMKEIIAVFIKADELGIKYHGPAFSFCPFCGSSFEDLAKFQANKTLIFIPKHRK